jgi:hypothetical protein
MLAAARRRVTRHAAADNAGARNNMDDERLNARRHFGRTRRCRNARAATPSLPRRKRTG